MESSVLSCLVNIFVDPKQALTDIRSHTQWLWYPLIIAIVISVGFSLWYFLTVDMDWFVNQTLAQMSAKIPADRLDQIRQHMSRQRFIVGSLIGTPLFMIAVYLLQTVYLFLISKLVGSEVQSFGQWFSFTSWTYLPNALASVASAIAYLFASGRQVSLYKLDVTSLNTLLFHLPRSNHWFGTLQGLHLTLFWALGLMIVGFSMWTKKGIGKSSAIVLAPYVVIYGVIVIIKLM